MHFPIFPRRACILFFLCAFLVSADAQYWPCQGTTVLNEDFSSGIPAGWNVVDGDTLMPVASLNLGKGWQPVPDPEDSTNTILVSASWYLPPGVSDDWVILPMTVLPSNPCFSFQAWSWDAFFPERMEVRIARQGDTTSLRAQVPVLVDSSVGGTRRYYSMNLSAYAHDTVYIAIHQFSDDQYVLALDNFRISDVEQTDAAVLKLDSIHVLAFDSTRITGEVVNAGSDTIRSVTLNWNADGGTVHSELLDSINLPPNRGYAFTTASKWSPDTTRLYNVCVWVSQPNGATDLFAGNDTLCTSVDVLNFIGVENEVSRVPLHVWPNPAARFICADIPAASFEWTITDLNGKCVGSGTSQSGAKIEIGHLAPGFYILCVAAEQFTARGKFLHE